MELTDHETVAWVGMVCAYSFLLGMLIATRALSPDNPSERSPGTVLAASGLAGLVIFVCAVWQFSSRLSSMAG